MVDYMNVKVLFIAVFLLIPGCIEDIPNPEEHESIVDRGYTNISMQIFH